jgi:glycosyltransferase involved in cell wall biosynthesis
LSDPAVSGGVAEPGPRDSEHRAEDASHRAVGAHSWRPGTAAASAPPAAGVRIVLDVRPLQDPDRAPTTAAYLGALLTALDGDPRPGESFSFLLASDIDDPTLRYTNLEVVGRRMLPPTRILRSGALTVDPILMRGASLGAGWRAERAGAGGSVYVAAAGALPLASRIPVAATLLDLAPWEMPKAFQRGRAARFGQRLRAQLLREAAAVLVGSEATARAARRLLRIRPDRLHVVRLAPRPAFVASAGDAAALPGSGPGAAAGPGAGARQERERLGLGSRYFVYAGRYDARQDLPTLLSALASLATAGRPGGLDEQVPWPPRICLVAATPDDREALSRAARRVGVDDLLAYAPRLPESRLAALVAGSRALVLPVHSEAAGLAALEALATGVPIVASAVGCLPELVGSAGILVDPGDPARLATALATAWADDAVHARLAQAARERCITPRPWSEVADEHRAIWAAVARSGPFL